MQTEKVIERFIRRKVKEAGASGVVVGLSGGIDSALVATLCVRALGRGKVTALIIPEKETRSRKNIEDASALARRLGIKCHIVDFSPVYMEFKRVLPIFREGKRIPNGNLRARIRMCILYYFANSRNLLVAGTGNKSELMLGYFTRYGDGGVDFLPIGGLYKTDVRRLAGKVGVPKGIIEKKPSPGLWAGQTTEGELRMNYGKLDEILMGLGRSDAALAKGLGLKESTISKVRERIKLMRYKCEMPELPRG